MAVIKHLCCIPDRRTACLGRPCRPVTRFFLEGIFVCDRISLRHPLFPSPIAREAR